ncbi:transcription factor EGL1-like [Iris pallida]|uniref:Transcription factor EGL1-like n=1 Tax=Iris pallida TaxID=29817 RepID=A0AAX6GBB9_IRIPA|nr:transcription factor EGL1-like [Iris pallida]KAJ6851535.1 transcription factor EGL1-like [Iris pallida]
MEVGAEVQEDLPEKDLRKQLAATVRSIQWSYAIFWSLSSRQQGVLAWGDGYYNGDIKTRKTTQPMVFTSDQMGLQRSEQLRELFETLSTGDGNQQTKRPSASLSPEDLTAAEWYYLVCMSFTFGPGQGMPGRALASNQHIWLSDAPFSDSKTFSRTLLAKSASIQTVVCFPFMGGVLELGTTESVLEDTNLIQRVTTYFWEVSIPISSEQSISSSPMAEKDEDDMDGILDRVIEDTVISENRNLVPGCQTFQPPSFALQSIVSNAQIGLIQDNVEELNPILYEELRICSPDNSSNEFCPNLHTDDSFRMEGLNGAPQIPGQQLMDDGISNCLRGGSLNSSDCVSQSFVNPQTLDLDRNEPHYQRTLAAILNSSKGLASATCTPRVSHASSFTSWGGGSTFPMPLSSTPQKLLKKILVDADCTFGRRQTKPPEGNGNSNRVYKSEADDNGINHVLSERRRREKLNEKFVILKSLVPSISKVDKASILGDTIEYIKKLERRVEELESSAEVVVLEGRGRRKHPDVAERTSDNYGSKEDAGSRKPPSNKRKARDVEEAEADCNHWFLSKDGAVDINVTTIEREVTIEMQCPWSDSLLLEVMEAMGKLNLDSHSVKSTRVDNVLGLTLKAKIKDTITVSPVTIKRALQRVVGKC